MINLGPESSLASKNGLVYYFDRADCSPIEDYVGPKNTDCRMPFPSSIMLETSLHLTQGRV
jgi:hypothetical protein